MKPLKLINPSDTIAILIGVSEFEDKAFINAPPIKNNVTKLAALLKDDAILGLKDDRILLLNNNESNGLILRKIRSFVKDNFADTVIFYFAGHGHKTDDDDFYLVTHNTYKEDIDATSVHWNKIKNIFKKGSGIKQRIYMLDACHSGAATLGDDDEETKIEAGSALIAAAKADKKAYFNSTDEYTHFTKALVDLLENGVPNTDMATFDTSILFDKLEKALSDEKFEITKKIAHKIDKVSFFKNKGFDPLSIKKSNILALIKEGDTFHKALEFEKAELRYHRAKRQAKPADKFEALIRKIETKIENNENIEKYKKVFETHFAKQLKDKESQLTELKSDLKNKQEELENILKKLATQQKQTLADQSNIADLQTAKEELTKKINTTKAELSSALKAINRQEKHITQLKKSAKQGATAYEQLQKENETIRKELKTLKYPPKPKPIIVKDNNIIQKIGTTSFEMILIKGSTFKMGSNTINMPDYYMAKYPVTQKLWLEVMGENPSHFKGGDHPVEQVSWNDAQLFMRELEAMTNKKYRLPSESEWEYAAKGGLKTKGFEYAGSNSIDKVAWYSQNSKKTTHPVGQKQANELGLYDMSGHVWEWCEDKWHGDYGTTPPDDMPTNGSAWESGTGSFRVIRGGSWLSLAGLCRVALRGSFVAGDRDDSMGFRLALSL